MNTETPFPESEVGFFRATVVDLLRSQNPMFKSKWFEGYRRQFDSGEAARSV